MDPASSTCYLKAIPVDAHLIPNNRLVRLLYHCTAVVLLLFISIQIEVIQKKIPKLIPRCCSPTPTTFISHSKTLFHDQYSPTYAIWNRYNQSLCQTLIVSQTYNPPKWPFELLQLGTANAILPGIVREECHILLAILDNSEVQGHLLETS